VHKGQPLDPILNRFLRAYVSTFHFDVVSCTTVFQKWSHPLIIFRPKFCVNVSYLIMPATLPTNLILLNMIHGIVLLSANMYYGSHFPTPLCYFFFLGRHNLFLSFFLSNTPKVPSALTARGKSSQYVVVEIIVFKF
jgi:hypothetical protein